MTMARNWTTDALPFLPERPTGERMKKSLARHLRVNKFQRVMIQLDRLRRVCRALYLHQTGGKVAEAMRALIDET